MRQHTREDDGAPSERRVFLIQAGKAFPVVAGALYLIGCDEAFNPSAVADISSVSTVNAGHSHTINVPSADQLHPAAKTYTSTSVFAHVHMVTLTEDQLRTLATGGSVTVTSTTSGTHTHDFTFQGKKSS